MKRFWFILTILASVTPGEAGDKADHPASATDPGSKVPRWRDTTGMAFVRGGELPRPGLSPSKVRSFYMDDHEVNNTQFSTFLSDGHGRFWNEKQAIQKAGDLYSPSPGSERNPVLHTSLEAALEYARWTGKRLPTREETEWAARSGLAKDPPMAVDDATPSRRGFRCLRPTRRVLVLVGENFEEVELGAYTGILSWANHTKPAGDYMFKSGAAEVPNIEVVIAGFTTEVHGMGGMNLRPHVLVKDLGGEELGRFDAVAIPATVGGARGQHTWQGRADLESKDAVAIVRSIHKNGGFVSTMCAGDSTLTEARLPAPKTAPDKPVALDPDSHTATSAGPGVALEAACLLVQQLVTPEEYRAFRTSNPWLFGGQDQYAPRSEILR